LPEIQHVYPLIHNKVTSPHYVTPTLRRARLLDWLHGMSTCRAVVIAADAGYGKTTLLWQWEREVGFPCYWYKLDRNDRDWSLHISYLIESISQRHPGFGRRAHSMLEQLGGPGSSRPGVAAYLLAEMYEKLTEPCTFIIDDWQFVASVTEVRGLWNQILRDAPPTCRFVFLSRAKPQLQFARFKTHGGYAEMRTDALRFTDHEIEELFRDIYNDPLDSVDVAELERRTEGWAASLQLVEVSLRERHRPEERRAFIQSITADTESDLVEFLAQEVLDQQPPSTRNFLLASAVLRQIHPPLAASLAGIENGPSILEELENGGLFTYRIDSSPDIYRFHGLFRDFLLRRLSLERTEGEVAALHIHAASYFETHALWPEAIHHYMEAGLQPQAARLIAKFGEDLVSSGRLPLLEEWMGALPPKAIRENARLSLLSGEIAGLAGRWTEALTSLNRARRFFSRKGDERLEAAACSKLSTVYNNLGDIEESARLATEGLALVPADAFATEIRLRGNLAVTVTWFESLEAAIRECKRLALESADRGFEHHAAITHHNLGMMLRDAGHLDESLANLNRAAHLWHGSPTNPFADNSELVLTLLALGRDGDAATAAEAGMTRTKPWPKANAEARWGMAAVRTYQGRFKDAIEILRGIAELGDAIGPTCERTLALLMECLYLSGGSAAEMNGVRERLAKLKLDPRLAPATMVALALAAHRAGNCGDECLRAQALLDRWRDLGAHRTADTGEIPLAVLALEHNVENGLRKLHRAIERDTVIEGARHWWLRRTAPYLPRAFEMFGPELLLRLMPLDADFWVPHAASDLSLLSPADRRLVLEAIQKNSGPDTEALLRGVDGSDAQELRRQLVQRFAPRIFVRSFGSLTLHRGTWSGPASVIGRRRIRLLLGLLVANMDGGLTRDQAIDLLWPDSDPASAINSLNQTVFQLRRLIEPTYREGESPQYVVSNVDAVQLNPDLVTTDLVTIREMRASIDSRGAFDARVAAVHQIVDLVRGEYLADLKYEDWVGQAQLSVHSEIRSMLLPVARGEVLPESDEWTLKAACSLVALDPYDEEAHVAMIRHLSNNGRRNQARSLATGFAERLRSELDEEPSDQLLLAARMAGATV
jgi:ATP/maltotriose-dependent transcriptional regulator MalT/DNA-binding SARP family transcriptional activator